MPTDIARLDLRIRRRGSVGITLGFAVYAALIVLLYPTFQHDTAFDELTRDNPTVSALFGATGSLTTPAGWMNANLFVNFVPLFALLMTIGYGAAAIAGQDEDGTLWSVASLPLTRTRVIVEKIAVTAVLALPVPLVTLAASVAGRGFHLDLDTGALLGTTVGAILLALDFGLVALVIGAWTGRRGLALGVATAVATASYVISALAPVVPSVGSVRRASLFYWAVGANQLVDGLDPFAIAVLAGVALGLAAGALGAFRRLDIH
ncbi:ABC transporter permease [Monashia sp. NPDC004114]